MKVPNFKKITIKIVHVKEYPSLPDSYDILRSASIDGPLLADIVRVLAGVGGAHYHTLGAMTLLIGAA